jgi:predicted metalloprotease with PDZ domain
VVAALLDIRLLELSHGKMGLREVINHLAKEYGPNKPFSEENFFDDFTDETFPEINDFFKDYIEGTNKLPVKEYFNKLGIDYFEQNGVDSSEAIMGISFVYDNGKLKIHEPVDKLQEGDVLYKLNGGEINLKNHFGILNKIKEMKVGTEYTITVKRGDEEITDTMHLKPKPIKHVFEINNDASPEQFQLRHAWMINLKD